MLPAFLTMDFMDRHARLERKLTMPTKSPITHEQWDHAATQYELGFLSLRQLGMALGVSPQTVMREMHRRGAVKACRVHETVVALEETITAKRRRAALAEAERQQSRIQRAGATMELLDAMVRALVEADRAGRLAAVNPLLRDTATALGVPAKHLSRSA